MTVRAMSTTIISMISWRCMPVGVIRLIRAGRSCRLPMVMGMELVLILRRMMVDEVLWIGNDILGGGGAPLEAMG